MRSFSLLLLAFTFIGCQNSTNNSGDDSDTPQTFVWNFSSPKTLEYHFSQTGEGFKKREADGEKQSLELAVEGQVDITTDEEGAGWVYITPKVEIPEGQEADPTRQQDPILLGGIDSTGVLNDPRRFFFQMLVGLPRKSLAVGQSDSFPVQTTESFGGIQIVVAGTQTITFEEYKSINGVQYAVLSAKVDMQESDLSDLPNSTYEGGFDGTGTFYYNVAQGCLASVDFELEGRQKFSRPASEDGTREIYQEQESRLMVELRLADFPSPEESTDK